MQTMTEDIKEILRANICYFATCTRGGKPNVVPVGLVEPVSDNEVLLVDVRFHKTRHNLEENKEVSIAVTDLNKSQAYQLKGKAEIITTGVFFEKVKEIMLQRRAKRRAMMEKRAGETQDPKQKKKLMERAAGHGSFDARAAVLIKINEIYSTM